MAKKVKQLYSVAYAIKERHSAVSKTGPREAVCGRPISLFRHLQHFGIIRQQSELRKKARYRMADDPERLEFQRELKMKTERQVTASLR